MANKHLNLFYSFGGKAYIEDNLTRNVALCIMHDDNFKQQFIKFLIADEISVDENIDVDVQVRTGDIDTIGIDSVVGFTLTAENISKQDEHDGAENQSICDIVIKIPSKKLLIIIEAKRWASKTVEKQLEKQLSEIKVLNPSLKEYKNKGIKKGLYWFDVLEVAHKISVNTNDNRKLNILKDLVDFLALSGYLAEDFIIEIKDIVISKTMSVIAKESFKNYVHNIPLVRVPKWAINKNLTSYFYSDFLYLSLLFDMTKWLEVSDNQKSELRYFLQLHNKFQDYASDRLKKSVKIFTKPYIVFCENTTKLSFLYVNNTKIAKKLYVVENFEQDGILVGDWNRDAHHNSGDSLNKLDKFFNSIGFDDWKYPSEKNGYWDEDFGDWSEVLKRKKIRTELRMEYGVQIDLDEIGTFNNQTELKQFLQNTVDDLKECLGKCEVS